MAPTPRMILTDLDHTLLRSDGSISQETFRVLQQCREKGMLLAIATARYWIGAARYIELLQPDYEITTDGTLVHAEGECIYSCAFTAEETNRIIEKINRRSPGAEITAAVGKTVYWNSRHIAASERLHQAVFWDYASPLACGANKIAASLPDESVAEGIAAECRCKLQGYRGENLYAFLPLHSGKTAAIRAMAETCGVALSDMAAFGDDRNDVEMLRLCGTGVAVANAIPEVLETADQTTASNDEDGVAVWLKRYCLK